MSTDFVPPLPILNEFLQQGIVDAGMSGGCEWTPFELSESEYEELLEELLTQNERHLSKANPPKNVQTYEGWIAWRLRQRR